MLMPKRVKYRKVMRGRMPGLAKGGHTVAFGEYGLHAGAGLDHEPPDRGRPARDDPLGQAWRQDLDPHLPGQAGDEEAGRDPHGLRQGRAGPLGRGRQAGPHPVRDGRRRPTTRPSRRCASQPQAAGRRPASSSATTSREAADGHRQGSDALRRASCEDALKEAKQDLWQARFALSTRQLKDYSSIPADTTNDRADPDRPARARARARRGARRREGDHAMAG